MDIRDMAQAEFDALMHKIRVTAPNVYQMIVDYSEGSMTAADAERFKNLPQEEQETYIINYQASC